MEPATISLILGFALKYGPGIASDVVAIFKKKDPTIADIEALFAKLKTYEEYNIPATA